MNPGHKIRELRKKKRLTQVDIASLVGVSKGIVSQWETGIVKKIGGETLLKLASVLGVEPAVLIDLSASTNQARSSDEENLLILYRSLTREQKQIAIRLLRVL